MDIKTYNQRKKEITTTAREVLNELAEEQLEFPNEEEKFKEVLEDPDSCVVEKVRLIAETVAGIKEVGLEANHPSVSKWVEKELGVTPVEFNDFLNESRTPEEAKENILKEMEAPGEVIDEVVNQEIKKHK